MALPAHETALRAHEMVLRAHETALPAHEMVPQAHETARWGLLQHLSPS